MPGLRLSVLMPVYNERYTVSTIVEKVLAMEGREPIDSIELIVVDDGSDDGTEGILETLAARHPQIALIRQENGGKGSAIRKAIAAASGDVCIVQDADLEYDPGDFPRMLSPFVEDGADVVYGSRFAPADRRRVLFFWHSLGNRLLTLLCNLISDLNLTDMETCYKAVRTEILKRTPLRSNDFAMEPELTLKLAKKGLQIFEVPINYRGRTYLEGKKIGVWDGVKALFTMLYFGLVDDLYPTGDLSTAFRRHVRLAPNLTRWQAEALSPHLGPRVLEIGAGEGSLALLLSRRDRYTATDASEDHLLQLRNLALGRPYLEVERLDPKLEADFEPFRESFDTVLAPHLLAQEVEGLSTLRRLRSCLAPGGRLLLLVPQGEERFCKLDETVGHRRRFSRQSLRRLLEEAGFAELHFDDFNRFGALGWHVTGKLLGRSSPSWLQMKIFNVLAPFVRHLDPLLPWPGLSLIVRARSK